MPQHLHHYHISVFIRGGDVGKRHIVFTRDILQKFDTGVFTFADKIEIRGIIPNLILGALS
ncbi:hypothetical protein ES707_02471 [subsurface metagenome]